MNASAVNHTGDGSGSTNDASRRTFLKGVGLAGAAGIAGAAGLTSPFLVTASARASGGVRLGVQAPGPWETTTYAGYLPPPIPGHPGQTWPDLISNALGCRSYGNQSGPATKPSDIPNQFPGWDIVDDAGVHRAVMPLASIRPDPNVLLGNDPNLQPMFDNQIKNMILDGKMRAANGQFAGAPRLTAWHEAGHLYQEFPYMDPMDSPSGVPTNATAAQLVRSMHEKMQKLVNDVNNNPANAGLPNVTYGCIIYGDVNKMANDSYPLSAINWVPRSTKDGGMSLDWYGIDLYFEDDKQWQGAAADCTHGNLDTYDKVKSHLDNFRQMAISRSGSQTPNIHVCESNANSSDAAYRPDFFTHVATWLSSYGGTNPHMLTFFPQGGGHHSVQWPPDQATINALRGIANP